MKSWLFRHVSFFPALNAVQSCDTWYHSRHLAGMRDDIAEALRLVHEVEGAMVFDDIAKVPTLALPPCGKSTASTT